MSKLESINKQKMGAICGIMVPITAFTSILTAIASYPEFSWTNNALSDLGVVQGITNTIFNFGLYTSGILALGFAVFGLFMYLGDKLIGKGGAVAFAVAGLAIMAIGFFNESFKPTHYIVSVTFFTVLPIALWLITAALYLKRQVKLALFTLLSSFVAAVPWILFFSIHYVPNVAIPEAVSAAAGCIWAIVISYKMYKATQNASLKK
jgi:hypothetical membrane protein